MKFQTLLKTGILCGALIFSTAALADDFTITIDSMSNVSGNGSIEACGTATHKSGVRPVVVTLHHEDSFYTTLTAPNDKWCVLFKRWSGSGSIDVNGSLLGKSGISKTLSYDLE